MGVDTVIRRKDRKPMGSPEEVQQRLSQSFPGSKFEIFRPGVGHGLFCNDDLTIQFHFKSTGPISEVQIAIYGKPDRIYEYTKNWSDWTVDVNWR
jgi:hypothetical protein